MGWPYLKFGEKPSRNATQIPVMVISVLNASSTSIGSRVAKLDPVESVFNSSETEEDDVVAVEEACELRLVDGWEY